jgi:putative (di)nucleoside polyphosphate hydrolase
MKTLPYRLGIGVVLLNKSHQVFIAKRIDSRDHVWQMPQGGIDEGEKPIDTLYREMLEEIGTNHAEVLYESQDWFHYDLPFHLIGKLWKGRYRGQKQKWFLCRFLGDDSDINIETKHPEFNAWRWSEFKEIPSLAVGFKQRMYQNIVAEFQPIYDQLSKS